jgi:hypothetical protein
MWKKCVFLPYTLIFVFTITLGQLTLNTNRSVPVAILLQNITYLPSGILFLTSIFYYKGRDSSVGIATRYGLNGPGIESRWGGGGGEIFRTRPDRPWDSLSLLCNGYQIFYGVKQPGRGVKPPTPSSVEVKGGV